MLDILDKDWEGYEDLLAYDTYKVPKYGNDIDYADESARFIMDTWCDIVDNINMRKEFLPEYGGQYICSTIVGPPNVGMGLSVAALPGAHKKASPISDTSSPVNGRDICGLTAVLRSNAKLPQQRMSMGNCLNQRLSPKMVATDDDIEKFTDYIMSINKNPVAEVQFNIISSDIMRRAMKDPDNYRDLLVRVASYQVYFVDLNPGCQQDIINRTEHQGW